MEQPEAPFSIWAYDIFKVIEDHRGAFVQHAVARHFTMSLRDAGQWVEYHAFCVKKKKLTALLTRGKNGATLPT